MSGNFTNLLLFLLSFAQHVFSVFGWTMLFCCNEAQFVWVMENFLVSAWDQMGQITTN